MGRKPIALVGVLASSRQRQRCRGERWLRPLVRMKQRDSLSNKLIWVQNLINYYAVGMV